MANDSRTQQMCSLVEQWKESGTSQKQFSTRHNIKLATFLYWVKKYRAHAQDQAHFARVDLSQHNLTSTSAKIEIALGDDIVVRIF
jgi:hypothetical protein